MPRRQVYEDIVLQACERAAGGVKGSLKPWLGHHDLPGDAVRQVAKRCVKAMKSSSRARAAPEAMPS
ncbi:MAG: hypothetical protein V5B32_15855, partial [Candidatus Accumulibacter sp. UW26]